MKVRDVIQYFILALLLAACDGGYTLKQEGYVKRNKCIACHQEEYDLHKGSHHDLAMELAISEYVLGDFNNVQFIYGTDTALFFKDEQGYKVRTQNEHGIPHIFTIQYTFGWTPLQQYLIEFPGGRYQVLPYCWDSRPAEEGGQRWYHIYNNEIITHTDPLYWTGKYQNWNHVCAECHSTNFKKNFNSKSLEYKSTWSEIDVSCDACHGPSKKHLKWARRDEKGKSTDKYPNKGYGFQFASRDSVQWIFDMEKGTAFAHGSAPGVSEIDVCARCHSRRYQIWDDYVHGQSILQTHIPEMLEPHLYYPDGQIMDEDYVYGSFLQSKMYKQGVSCSDCHDPHSMQVQAQGNALCAKCHVFTKYNSREHHFHNPDSTGGSCQDCHMPRTTYMGVDRRLDHSIRIPRPDLSDKIGAPNACIQCHTDETNAWATKWFKLWYGTKYDDSRHYGEVFYDATNYLPQAFDELVAIASNSSNNDIIRASALRYLEYYPSNRTLEVLRTFCASSSAMIRVAAMRTLKQLNVNEATKEIVALSSDTVRAVRHEAAGAFANLSSNSKLQIPTSKQKEIINEYINTLLTNADQAASYVNMGLLYQNMNSLDSAGMYYQKALDVDSLCLEAGINISDLHRLKGLDSEAFPILNEMVRKHAYRPEVYYALGMWYTRQKQPERALELFRKTTELEPESTYYLYVYSVALHSMGRERHAKQILHRAYDINPYDYNILYMLSAVYKEIGDVKRYERYYYELENLER